MRCPKTPDGLHRWAGVQCDHCGLTKGRLSRVYMEQRATRKYARRLLDRIAELGPIDRYGLVRLRDVRALIEEEL